MGQRKKKSTTTLLRENFDRGSGILLGLSIACAIVVATLSGSHSISLPLTGWGVAIVAVALLGSFFRPLLAIAGLGYESVFSTCVLGGFLFACALTAFYLSYYLIVGNLSSQGSAAKLLDLPPLLLALWAAITGWYVHFQLTCRNHRVSNAVSIVLSRSTNADLRRRLDMLRKYLPTKQHIDELDTSFFRRDSMERAKAGFKPDDPQCVRNMRLTQSVDALKYLLNYYEFMAVAIALGDLEESIVYETVSPHVVGLYDRAAAYLKFARGKEGGEPLAFEHLGALVDRWTAALKIEGMQF
jgi:hypothetical protein